MTTPWGLVIFDELAAATGRIQSVQVGPAFHKAARFTEFMKTLIG
jgi:hypothetical protein